MNSELLFDIDFKGYTSEQIIEKYPFRDRVELLRYRDLEDFRLITTTEADAYFQNSYDTDILPYCSFFFLCDELDTQYIHYYILYIRRNNLTDDKIELLINKILDNREDIDKYDLSDVLSELVGELRDDNTKLKYMKYIPGYARNRIISSLSNDKIKLDNMGFFTQDKEYIIASLDSDETKLKYLKTIREKDTIIRTLSSDELKVECLKRYSLVLTKSMICNIITSFKDKNLMLKYVDKIKDEDYGDIASKLSKEELLKFYYKCTNDTQRFSIICSTWDEELRNKMIRELSDVNNILKKIDDYSFSDDHKLLLLDKVNDFKLMKKIIDHMDYISTKEICPNIIDLYSKKYKVNEMHLTVFISKYGYEVLKLIDNKNIVDILNLDDIKFGKVLALFNKNNIELKLDNYNDVFNSILQRFFARDSKDVINVFAYIRDCHDRQVILDCLNVINKTIPIVDYTTMDLESFITGIDKNDKDVLEILHGITDKYIRVKRNEYVKNNLIDCYKNCAHTYYDDAELIKYIINNSNIDKLIEVLGNLKITDESLKQLVDNKEVLKKIILFKQQHIGDINEIKQYFPDFKKIMDILVKSSEVDHNGLLPISKIYEPISKQENELLEVFSSLDVDVLDKLLSDDELYTELLGILKKTKVLGWSSNITSLAAKADLFISSETLANFINYYYDIREKSSSKDSITKLLDLANCYNKVSNKYNLLFGTENSVLISTNPGPNAASLKKEDRIDLAEDCVRSIYSRTKIPVPGIDRVFESSSKGLRIIVGDTANMDNITLGERTGACMRIGGAGESLFNFCLKNNNGFNVIFKDPDTDEFISRVSGFRNGNTVFLNQLRTPLNKKYSNRDLVECVTKLSRYLIEVTKNSDYPIDNVVISNGYAMSGTPLDATIHGNIKKGLPDFYSDVDSECCLLASRCGNGLSPVVLGPNKVEYYPHQRKKVISTKENINDYINHLMIVDHVIGGSRVSSYEEKEYEYVFGYFGEDWFAVIDNNGKIESYVLPHSSDKERAMSEMKEYVVLLTNRMGSEVSEEYRNDKKL